jgi:hypothetical protein
MIRWRLGLLLWLDSPDSKDVGKLATDSVIWTTSGFSEGCSNKAQKFPYGRFTPRGRANLLCKRLEILTCDWSKG